MSNVPVRYAIDASVILRFLLGDDARLSSRARRSMEALEAGHIVVSCDPVTLAEVVWVLSSFYKLTNHEISEALLPILSHEGLEIPHKDRYLLALRLFGATVQHYGDACACANAATECEGRLLSFDKRLSSVEGVRRSEQVEG